MLSNRLIALSGLLSLVLGSPIGPEGSEVTCFDIVDTDQIEDIQENVLQSIAKYKRAHNRQVTYCPGNSTLLHQLVEGDGIVISRITTFDNSTAEQYDNLAQEQEAPEAVENGVTPIDKRQYKWFNNEFTDCSIVCGEPNPNHCQELHRDRYYGYIYQDAGFWLNPGQQWDDNFSTCWFTMRNVNAPARSLGPDGQLQTIEVMYNSCLYWSRIGGRSIGTRPGWLAYAGHRDTLNNANGRTQCLNSVNAKRRLRRRRQPVPALPAPELQVEQEQAPKEVRSPQGASTPPPIGPKPKPSSHANSKVKIIQGKISPELLRAMEEADSTNSSTSTLSKRQYWNVGNINPGTATWRIDCGALYPGDVSLVVDFKIPYGGNTNADFIVQPASWSAITYESAAFVVFNRGCCNAIVVDFVHVLHDSALLGFHNAMKRGGTGNYGSAANSFTAGVYFAWMKQSYLNDDNRMGRCINVPT